MICCYGGTNFIEFGLPRYVARHIERERIDTIVCINPRPMLYSFLAGLFTCRKIRIIQVLHIATPVTRYQRLKNHLLYRPLFSHCDPVIFVSEEQRRQWYSNGFIKVQNSVRIYNGVDVDHFTDHFSAEEKLTARHRLGLSAATFVVGIFARLHLNKNHSELITAVEMIRSAGMDARLLVVGDGPEKARLEELIESRKLEQSVILTGFQKDIRLFMSISDCIVLIPCGIFPPCHN